MIDALVTGKLFKQPELKTSKTGKSYCNFLLSVAVGEPENVFVSGIAFGDVAERLAKLGKGDAVALAGSLKPSEWEKNGQTQHGLNLTVNQMLSVYDIKKRRPLNDSKNT